MKTLKENIKTILNETTTTNGDLAFKSTLNANLDLFAIGSSLRYGDFKNYKILKLLLDQASKEDILLTIKNVFYIRDVRNGNKERALGRFGLVFIANNYPKTFIKLIHVIPDLGRFDDLVYVLTTCQNENVKREIANFINTILTIDYTSENPTLLAKWLPTTDAGKKANGQAKIVAKYLNKNIIEYNKLVKRIRKKLNILETKIVNKEFTQIEYSKVPSQAMKKYYALFAKKDYARYKNYLKDVENNKNSIKTTTLLPYQIVEQMRKYLRSYNIDKTKEKTLNLLWNNLDRVKTDKNIIVVRDGSGSMLYKPLDIANSLCLYMSECLNGSFKDTFITFSSKPELITISKKYKTLKNKLKYIDNFDDCTTTNIYSVYELLLKASMNIPKEDQIDTVIIVSDMQFNYVDCNQSTYNKIKKQYEYNNIKFPHIVFWNVNSQNLSYPASKYDNVSLVSGFSTEIFKTLLQGNVINPIDTMIKALSTYDYLEELIYK